MGSNLIDERLRNNVRNVYFKILIQNEKFLETSHSNMLSIVTNLEFITQMSANEIFISRKVKDLKRETIKNIYANTCNYFKDIISKPHIVEGILEDPEKYYDIIVRKDIRDIADENTMKILLKQEKRKGIKIDIAYSDEPCRYCNRKAVTIKTHTRSIDECDVVIKKCQACNKKN